MNILEAWIWEPLLWNCICYSVVSCLEHRKAGCKHDEIKYGVIMLAVYVLLAIIALEFFSVDYRSRKYVHFEFHRFWLGLPLSEKEPPSPVVCSQTSKSERKCFLFINLTFPPSPADLWGNLFNRPSHALKWSRKALLLSPPEI